MKETSASRGREASVFGISETRGLTAHGSPGGACSRLHDVETAYEKKPRSGDRM